MQHQQIWSVVGLVERNHMAHVSLARKRVGHEAPVVSPTLVVELSDAPHLGDPVLVSYSWGNDFHGNTAGTTGNCKVCDSAVEYLPRVGMWRHTIPDSSHDVV